MYLDRTKTKLNIRKKTNPSKTLDTEKNSYQELIRKERLFHYLEYIPKLFLEEENDHRDLTGV